MSKEKFNYVIAKPWDSKLNEPTNHLCIYSYCGQIQFGTMKNALELLSYVQRSASHDSEDSSTYTIYKVSYEKIENT